MGSINAEIVGLEKIVNKLNAIGENTDEIIDTALLQSAKKIQRDAKKNIDILKAYDTGRLKGSISVEKIEKGYAIGTNVHYAPYVEFGTGSMGDPVVPHTNRHNWRYKDSEGKWHTAKAMPPRPFLRRAFHSNKTYVVKKVRNDLISTLKGRLK